VAKRAIVRTGTTVEQMVRAIADLIVTGALQPGEKLDEGSMATRFDVSRTPVREALRQLCAMGLVERPPNKRAVVTNVTGSYLSSMFEAMAELESICARLAAERMTELEKRALAAMHENSKTLVERGRSENYAAYNVDFHTSLYAGAHNNHVFELVTQTRARLAPFRQAQFRLEGRLEKSWSEHSDIVAAILKSDSLGAAKAAYDHVAIVKEASSTFVRVDAL